MNIKIGEKIKNLRKKHSVTQDKFAEYLGVSPQAVSRWENEDCYPDVEMFPAIANFFSITIDELFETDRSRKRQKDLYWEIYQKNAHGYIDEAIALAREAIREFPNSYLIMYELKNVLFNKDSIAHKDEILSLAKRILEDAKMDNTNEYGTESDVRYGTIQTMALTYFNNGEDEKAKEMINRLPSIFCTQETMMSCVTKGEDRILHIMREIFYTFECLGGAIYNLAQQDYDFCGENSGITKEKQKIMIYEKSIKLMELIFDDGNFGFYNHRIANRYEKMAENYILLNEYENALDCLEKAADYYIDYEKCADDESEFTAMLVSKIPNPPGHHHDKPSNMTYDFINDILLKKEIYIPIREHERFKAITEKLTPYAKARQY